jgi:hypothetical protein
MLDWISRLLVALAVATGAAGVGTAAGHAAPGGSVHAQDAIQAIIDSLSSAVTQAEPAGSQPEATGLDRAGEVANDHAADGLQRATDATTADHGKPADAGSPAAAPAADPPTENPPVAAPPVDTPPAQGPPATHPPVPAPPVAAPPVDAPGQANRP